MLVVNKIFAGMDSKGLMMGVPSVYVEVTNIANASAKKMDHNQILVSIITLGLEQVVVYGPGLLDDDYGYQLLDFLDLLKRRGLKVLTELKADPLNPEHLSSVMIRSDFSTLTVYRYSQELMNYFDAIGLANQHGFIQINMSASDEIELGEAKNVYIGAKNEGLIAPYQLALRIPKTNVGKSMIKELVRDDIKVRFVVGSHYVTTIKGVE